jgi:anti-sigma factor RsiW
MEPDIKPDEILANALVDGELSPAEHASAAARLRCDRDFARAYATLTKLKASVTEVVDDFDVPSIVVTRTRIRSRWATVGVAASLVIVLSVAALFVDPSPFKSESPRTEMPHARFAAVTFAGEPVIPDLSQAGLQLTRTVVSTASGTQSIVATYVGPRGCRLELWVSDASSSEHAPRGTERRSWRVGGLRYELVAYGMPAERFQSVADAAESATRATAVPENVDRRLIEARISTAPCVT